MNLKKLLIAAILSLTFLSCTKKEINIYVIGGGTETGTTYVKLSLDAKTLKAKSPTDHGSLEPTADETQIYNYALFVFKATGMLEARLLEKTENLQSPLLPDAQGLLTFSKTQNDHLIWNETEDGIQLSAGAKTFFAIVNAPAEFIDDNNSFIYDATLTLPELKEKTLTLGGNLNKIVGSYNASGAPVYFDNPVNTSSDNRGFMMTNIITDKQWNGFLSTLVEETEESDPSVSITVAVGIATAKVSLASNLKPLGEIYSQDPNQPQGALEITAYKIINNPNEMNVALAFKNGIVSTPYMGYGTPNPADYFVSNNSSHESDDYYIPVSKAPNNRTFIYCIENANNTPIFGNTTMALIKGFFTPLASPKGEATLLDAYCNPAALNSNGDFYRIWIEPYIDTNGDAQGGVYAPEYFTALPNLDAYRAYVVGLGQDLPASVELKISTYLGGLCYYYLPLYNEDSDSPYTVVRNSYYRIDIESVSGPGYPEGNPGEPGGPNKPDPELPIEGQTNLQAALKVSQLVGVDQIGKL